MKFVHIIDDEKFSGMAIKSFDAAFPGFNKYVSFSKTKRKIEKEKLTIYPRYFVFFKPLVRHILDADVVIFHSMNEKNLLLLRSVSNTTRVIWIGWGFDYYDLINVNLLKPKTLQIFNDNKSKNKKNVKGWIINTILGFIKKNKRKIIDRVNVFSPVLYEDFVLIKKFNPDFNAKYVSWNYGTLEDDHIIGFEDKIVNGDNILIGNSATYESNHADIFNEINNYHIKGRKIIVPLSYGDEDYKNEVLSIGSSIFNEDFMPLIDYLSMDDYIKKLQSCSIVIMNHIRQQALGNIVIALYLGAKVFLDSDNPIYAFFSKHGAYVYPLEQLKNEVDVKLTVEQMEKNREVLRFYWGRSAIYKKTKNIIQEALD
ncbi:TDP-N-acetylfucosamine:lipid II N-acetylfucosaminyltransferase [Vibrio metschnikovii]|uniref:TDP-N-acetylfucosamine:lipid II N-acetylfucosaminyltransferase n=1 Tax=Vibrio metschnikovii TaxID=28172 RepID=UPI002FC95485|nr:TDP-N-acetylfucosamine:lipid II N-acetylfucosaminyltransferase [Vibrio metschnikovii]